jgi:hypothetical protein
MLVAASPHRHPLGRNEVAGRRAELRLSTDLEGPGLLRCTRFGAAGLSEAPSRSTVQRPEGDDCVTQAGTDCRCGGGYNGARHVPAAEKVDAPRQVVDTESPSNSQ